MKTQHENSPCCRGRVIKFGKRRRQCVVCRKTRRIYQRARGRKKKREPVSFLLRYLRHELPSLHALAKSRQRSEDQLNRRMQRSLRQFLRQSRWPALPAGPLVALGDAMVHAMGSHTITIYFILLKPPQGSRAIIVPPYIHPGIELAEGWSRAFRRLSKEVLTRIKALVCDGHTGLTAMAKRQLWIMQRCHFHLIYRLQNYRSKYGLSRHGAVGRDIYRLVKKIIQTPEESEVRSSIEKLESWARVTKSRGLRDVVSGFVRCHRDYRSYLNYPELNLPQTTNAVESLIGGIRNLCHRARGFRTLNSLVSWICAFLKSRQTVTCNGRDRQPNNRG